MKFKKPIVSFFLLLSITCVSNLAQGALDNLSTIKHGVSSKRVSSYDTTGANQDRIPNIKPGEKVTIAEIEGPGIINHIWLSTRPPGMKRKHAGLIIRIYWDDNDYPSVEAPLGPFFGQGWDENYPFASLPLTAAPKWGNGLVSYFKMPFKKKARIEIESELDVTIKGIAFHIDYLELESSPEDIAYFHARYNHEITRAPIDGENEWGLLANQGGKNPKGESNHVILDTKGKGHFVGLNYYINCPTTMWYGEGDDMIFIDGDKRPTLHGTGTEAYFNTALAPDEPYLQPHFGIARSPDMEMNWLGRTHVYRFHIDDPIHFDESFRFTFEHGHNNHLTLELSSVAYWYQDKPTQLAAMPSKKTRKYKPEINFEDVHRWRHEWRKNYGAETNPWGNEHMFKKE
ncbi:DUF2961 domain-containing protein [Puniceicoccaceae bacterium K14]|nr:DUF2961 domain-containing protein [Puniceicoccaceae bacterium K14]